MTEESIPKPHVPEFPRPTDDQQAEFMLMMDAGVHVAPAEEDEE